MTEEKKMTQYSKRQARLTEEKKVENRLEQRLKHYTKYRLLIIDEIGYLPLEKRG